MISSIKLENIHKQHEDEFFLNIDDLVFCNKHIHVIVGPNGSGKSTLLNLVSFVDKPDKGKILINDKPVSYKNRLRKKIGFVRQSPYLFNTSVFENIALGLKIRKHPKNEIISRVNKILDRLKIQHLADRNVRKLSKGEYQRTAIAQIFVLEPEIILMDEPMANIDAQSTLSIEEIVKGIQKKSNSVIVMTTHSLTQAYRISPEIISIRQGKIVDFVHENVFFGKINSIAGGLQCMNAGKGIDIILSTEKKTSTSIAIDPKNVLISKNVVKTSARNTFKGKIIKIELLGPNVRLLVDVGVNLYSIITKQSFDEMNINLGSTVYVSFKVNSVEVI